MQQPNEGIASTLPDLDSPEQIAEMVRRFYADVADDELLGPVFNDVAKVDWAEHLPKLAAFWSRTLLGIDGYAGNPMAKHAAIHRQNPLDLDHFQRWLTLFHVTLRDGWAGPNTDRAFTIATNVARTHASQLLGPIQMAQPGSA